MITSFIIHYMSWQEGNELGAVCPKWPQIPLLACCCEMLSIAFLDPAAFYVTNPGNGCKPVLDERFGLKSLFDDRIDFAPLTTESRMSTIVSHRGPNVFHD